MNKYKSIAVSVIILALILVIVGFAEVNQEKQTITDIEIRIDDQYENYFISESDVLQILNKDVALKGSEYNSISLKNLEEALESNQFVYRAEIFKDLDGKWYTFKRPVAKP